MAHLVAVLEWMQLDRSMVMPPILAVGEQEIVTRVATAR